MKLEALEYLKYFMIIIILVIKSKSVSKVGDHS